VHHIRDIICGIVSGFVRACVAGWQLNLVPGGQVDFLPVGLVISSVQGTYLQQSVAGEDQSAWFANHLASRQSGAHWRCACLLNFTRGEYIPSASD